MHSKFTLLNWGPHNSNHLNEGLQLSRGRAAAAAAAAGPSSIQAGDRSSTGAGAMALSQSTQLGLATALFGVLSFVLAVLAELKKPPYGTPIKGRDVVVCRFPPDPTVALGALSALAAACSAGLGALAVFFPYGGRRVPTKALFAHTPLYVFFHVAVGVTAAGVGTTVWATATEAMHYVRNVHRDLAYACPTAKTGVLGGAAFLNLDAMLFWIVCLMLGRNVREDYFDDHGGGCGDDGVAAGTAGIEEK